MLVSRCFSIICVVFSTYKHYLYSVKCDTNIKKHNVIIEGEKYYFVFINKHNKDTMNKYLTIIAAIFLLLCSCSKEESNEPLPPAESNVYYVKYEVKVLVPNHFSQTITYTTESGVRTVSTTSSTWEGTYGPFKKGDLVKLTAKAQASTIKSTNYIRIYVSCNNSPFGIKKEASSDYNNPPLSISYTMP